MAILDSEIVWRPAALVSDSTPAQNGGRMLFSQIVSAVKNNLFPDVSQSERNAGSVKRRKAFIHIASAQDSALLNVRLFLDALTPAGDFVVFYPGTSTDTEDQMVARPYGVGTLHGAASAGATQVQVDCEHNAQYATLQPVRVGDLLRVSDAPGTGGSGHEEFVTVSAVSYGASFATIDFTPALANAYAMGVTLVSSVLELASIAGAISAPVVASSAGTLDAATVGNLVANNKGAIPQTWTLTFNSATTFTASGHTVGALPSAGATSADFAPTNPATGTPYFTLKASTWGGTFAVNDTVVFTSDPASVAIWYRREVPAGTSSLANDYASLAIQGESA